MFASERGENYERSVWNYIEGRYSLTEKFYHGMNTLKTPGLSAWVEFAFHGTLRREVRSINQERPGSLVRRNLYVTIFVKPTDSILTISTIRDELIHLLRRAVIEVRDWVGNGGQTVVGTLNGHNVIVDTPANNDDELSEHVLVFEFRHSEQFSRATS